MQSDVNAAPVRLRIRSYIDCLFQPVDIAALATFRIMFGALMVWEVWRYMSKGRIGRYYLEPEFLFSYYGFDWVKPWPGDGMFLHFWALGILGVMITLGIFYRVAMVLFFVGFTYVFLLDQARYLNHFYLVSLIAFLLCFLPAARAWSLDAWISRSSDPRVPRWTHWLLLLQFEIMYIFAGLVKINGDWLQLEPLRTWLNRRSDTVFFGSLFEHDWVIAAAAYGSIALHVIGAPLLLWKRTRIYVFILYVLFHLSNHMIFTIGIFPWVAIAGTLLFFGPSWPRDALRRVVAFFRLAKVPALKAAVASPSLSPASYQPTPPVARIAVLVFVLGWATLQIAVPLRHYLYPGNVSWHEQGHRFAWQMKLRQKRGEVTFTVTDPATGEVWIEDPADYLNRRQLRKMAGRPDMILQFAHHLGHHWREYHGVDNPEVRADSWASLNGRERERFLDPHRDLMKVPRNLRNADWILPLQGALPGYITALVDEEDDD